MLRVIPHATDLPFLLTFGLRDLAQFLFRVFFAIQLFFKGFALYCALAIPFWAFLHQSEKSESAQLWDKHNMTFKRIVKINQIKR